MQRIKDETENSGYEIETKKEIQRDFRTRQCNN